MNRNRQMAKDIANKSAQAREEYEKNKPLFVESKIQEKIDDAEYHEKEEEEKLEENEEKAQAKTPDNKI